MNQSDLSESEVKHLIQRHWSARAATFDERPNHGIHSDEQHSAWLGVLGRLAGPEPLQVLDLGCGTGFLSLLFAELGHRVIGIDLSKEMLALARQKAELAGLAVAFRQGDAESPDDLDATCDLIVARHLIWTLPAPSRAVQEWRRALKPGGRVALVEGNWGGQSIQKAYEPIRDRLPFFGGQSGEELAAFLRAQGLRGVVVEPLLDPVLWGEQTHQERYLVSGVSSAQ